MKSIVSTRMESNSMVNVMIFDLL